jgi:hypothetical protein
MITQKTKGILMVIIQKLKHEFLGSSIEFMISVILMQDMKRERERVRERKKRVKV